jgi:hypothetical protein
MKRIDYLEFVSLIESSGVTDRRFIAPLFSQLTEADGFGGDGTEFAASLIQGMKPRDHLEILHAAQMAVVHWATMKYFRQVGASVGTVYQEVAVATATKLARTFTAQMEAFKRCRAAAEQKVTVQHVAVSGGAQAIVGNVTHAVRETAPDKAATSPPALTDARMAPMPMLDKQERAPVALPRGKKDDRQSSA